MSMLVGCVQEKRELPRSVFRVALHKWRCFACPDDHSTPFPCIEALLRVDDVRSGRMSEETSRMNVHEIFEAAVSSARDELQRSTSALGVSGLAGGMTMGLSG